MPSVLTRVGCDAIDWTQLVHLYSEVGLVAGFGKARDRAAIESAFRSSDKVVSAWDSDVLVAAGRMLTDHVCYACIFDIGVLSSHQRQGFGNAVMLGLLDGCDHLYVHLTSTFGKQPFYEQLGFRRHKTAMARYPGPSDYLE